MVLNEEQLEADEIIVDGLKFVGGILILGIGGYLAFESLNSNTNLDIPLKIGIEEKLNLKQDFKPNFNNQTQYTLRSDENGCAILDRFNYLSDDTKLYSMQSEYLFSKNPQDNCRKF